MKKHRKLDLRKLSVAKLTSTSNIVGGIITTQANCEYLDTIGVACVTVGLNSCLDNGCNNQTYEFETCNHQGTLETRTGDSLIKFTDNM